MHGKPGSKQGPAGVEVLPPLACHLVGRAEVSRAAHVSSSEPKLLAIRALQIEYDLRFNTLKPIEMQTMHMPLLEGSHRRREGADEAGRYICEASFDDSSDNLDSNEPDNRV